MTARELFDLSVWEMLRRMDGEEGLGVKLRCRVDGCWTKVVEDGGELVLANVR